MAADSTILNGALNISSLISALQSLKDVLLKQETSVVRDATIQRFEYTFELSWKTLKKILKYKGLVLNNPRDVFREAAQQGFIDNPQDWFQYLEFRNMTVHVYDEEIAKKIYAMIPDFETSVSQLLDAIQKL